jgi:hypothetical protein
MKSRALWEVLFLGAFGPAILTPSPLEFESYNNNSKLGRRLIVLLKPSVSDNMPSFMHWFTRAIPSRPVAILFDSQSLLLSPRNPIPTQAMPANLLQPTGLKNIATHEFSKKSVSLECQWDLGPGLDLIFIWLGLSSPTPLSLLGFLAHTCVGTPLH